MCDKRDRGTTCEFYRDIIFLILIFQFISYFLVLYKKICLKKVKFGGRLFQRKLLSRLSHKVCRLLYFPVLLRKFSYKAWTARAEPKIKTVAGNHALSQQARRVDQDTRHRAKGNPKTQQPRKRAFTLSCNF